MNNVIIFLAGIIIGFLCTKVFKIIQLCKYHKDVSDTLLRCLNMENDYAKALGANSMIEHTISTKGLSYAIFYYGSIYHLLAGQHAKEEPAFKVETELAKFLREAMKEDINEYKCKQLKRKQQAG